MKERSKRLITLLLYLFGAVCLAVLLLVPANEYGWMAGETPGAALPEDPDAAMRIGIFAAPAVLAALVILAASFAFWKKRGRLAALAYAVLVAVALALKLSSAG